MSAEIRKYNAYGVKGEIAYDGKCLNCGKPAEELVVDFYEVEFNVSRIEVKVSCDFCNDDAKNYMHRRWHGNYVGTRRI
jgi:hypothetical protein